MAQMGTRSRFKFSEAIYRNGKETFGMWIRPNFMKLENVPENSIITVAVNQSNAGRPDLIARDYYGDDRLEWVVIMFNRPLNPLGWPKAGTVIKIPSSSVVYSNLI